MEALSVKKWRNIDPGIAAICLALIGFSVTMIYSVGSTGDGSDPFNFAKRQLLWAGVGLVLMTGLALIDYKRLKPYFSLIYGINIVLLLGIALFGKSSLGAQRWFSIGSFQFQPSEFAKLAMIITLAAFLAKYNGELNDPKTILQALFLMFPPLILILLQPDLGTAMVFVAIMIGMLIPAGIKFKHLAVIIILGMIIIGLVFQLNLLKDYQQKRLVVFLNPDIDPAGSGYNLRQSMIAIGSGGLFGKGLFSGTQSQLNFIPERHTDFIFAVIGEELGLIGGIALIACFFLLFTRSLAIGANSRNIFGLLMASGITTMWVFQVLVNIGMTIGIMPIAGIPLPFISYGGSSMMTNMAAVGILLSINGNKFK